MLKFLPLLVLLVVPVLSEPKPDLTVPATITGVSTGSLDTTGNIVANVDRILNTLNQFYSIVGSLYYIESPQFGEAADNFRYVMDSLVEAGSPVFQSLSNVAKVSSGDVKKAFGGIQANIKNAVALNPEHLQLVNQSQNILGENTTVYFDDVLNKLASNLGNMSNLLDRIQNSIVEIQQLDTKSQASIKPLLPNDDIKALNAVLRQYIQIGDAAIPEVRSVVNRIRTVDSFQVRLRNVVNQQRQYLNSSLARIPPLIQTNVINRFRTSISGLQTQVVTRSNKAVVTLTNFLLDNAVDLKESANRTIPVMLELGKNVSRNSNILLSRVDQLTVSENLPYIVFNNTEQLIEESSTEISLAMAQRLRNADTCYARYNYDFDKIPRMVYSQLYNCMWDTANDLSLVATNLNSVMQLALVDVNNGILAVERCASLVTSNAPEVTKSQAATCLDQAREYLSNRHVYVDQLANYQRMLEKEILYSAQRYNFCMATTQRQAFAQAASLYGSINRCLNITPTVSTFKFRIRGKITVGFGK